MPLPAALGKLSLAAFLAIGSLAACTTVPPSTIAALDRLDVALIDPAALRLGLVVPSPFLPDAGQPELTVTIGSADGDTDAQTFVLVERTSGAERAPLLGEVRPGSELRVYGLAASDAAAFRRELERTMAEVPEGERQIALAVGMTGCTTEPARRLPATIYVSWASSEPYRVLVRSTDLSAAAGMRGGVALCD